MEESASLTRSSVDRQDLSLDELLRLPIEDRCRYVLKWGKRDIQVAIQKARDDGIGIPESFDSERLAWAVAFNIEGYTKRLPSHTWNQFWSRLTKPRATPIEADPVGWTLLRHC